MARPSPGLTLLECLVALAVLGISLALALPAFGELVQRHRTAVAVNELVASMHLARSTAVTRRASAAVCPSDDGQRCTRATDWSRGWIVFARPGRDGQPRDSEAIIQRVARGDAARIRIHSTAGRNMLRYHPQGYAGGSNLTLTLCEAGRLRARIVVNNTGRPRTETAPRSGVCRQ